MNDAVVVARGRIDGYETIVAAMEYGFIGGSMGVVVGEKITQRHRARARDAPADDHRLVLGRRPHDGRRLVADADGENLFGARAARSGAHSLHLDPHRSDHRRRHRELRDARRPEHRRARRADRLRGPARHRADDPPEAARRISAQRVPARARHARPHRRSPRNEEHHREGASIHGAASRRGRPSRPEAAVAEP